MEQLKQVAAGWGIHLTTEQLEAFQRYYEELVTWNRRMNLTAITDYEEVQIRHFADSLAVLLALEEAGKSKCRLIDIGTGAGFPGLPLKLARPHWHVTLVESTRKKTTFLRHLVEALDLDDVEVVPARAEEVGQDPRYREQFDLATARAVADLAVLVEYALPLVRIGGRFIAQKGATPEAELEAAGTAIQLLGGRHVATMAYNLPGHDASLHLVVIEKIAPTPAKYPRRPGMPEKRPLGGRSATSRSRPSELV
jgi:16S rRNA (guanine527-N7)-methyltransferase